MVPFQPKDLVANLITASTANEAWLRAVELLRSNEARQEMPSRIGMTTELLHVMITIADPRQRWVYARYPVISPGFALAESIWIANGRNDAEVLNFLNRDLPKFAGQGTTYYGAYGFRLRHQHGVDQLNAGFRALSSNPSSRQIVLQIWDVETDLPEKSGEPRSKDIPCNTQSILRVQNGKLHWLQTMRSNDVFRGLPYNLVQFTTLQEIFAGWLGLEVGSYSHTVSSLHVYNSDLDALNKATSCDPVANTDDLRLSKDESDRTLGILDSLLTKIPDPDVNVMQLVDVINCSNLPAPYRSIGLTILAEAARRHNNSGLAYKLIEEVSNKCLASVSRRWLARMTPT